MGKEYRIYIWQACSSPTTTHLLTAASPTRSSMSETLTSTMEKEYRIYDRPVPHQQQHTNALANNAPRLHLQLLYPQGHQCLRRWQERWERNTVCPEGLFHMGSSWAGWLLNRSSQTDFYLLVTTSAQLGVLKAPITSDFVVGINKMFLEWLYPVNVISMKIKI